MFYAMNYLELPKNLSKFSFPLETQIFPVKVKSVLTAYSVLWGAEGDVESEQLIRDAVRKVCHPFFQWQEKNVVKLAQDLHHPSFRISQLKVHHPCNKFGRKTASSKVKNSLQLHLRGKKTSFSRMLIHSRDFEKFKSTFQPADPD